MRMEVRIKGQCCGGDVVLSTDAQQSLTANGYARFGRWMAHYGDEARCEECGGVFWVDTDVGNTVYLVAGMSPSRRLAPLAGVVK